MIQKLTKSLKKMIFQDRNLTWDTEDPFFTPCFEETVLVWIPATFILAFAVFDIQFSLYSPRQKDPIPWNAVTVLKCSINLALGIVAVVNLIKIWSYPDSQSDDSLASGVRLVSYVSNIFYLSRLR